MSCLAPAHLSRCFGESCAWCRRRHPSTAAVDDLAREGQDAAINSAPEPVPCSIEHTTHCCEYHGIHSGDDLDAAIALLREAADSAEWYERVHTFLARVAPA